MYPAPQLFVRASGRQIALFQVLPVCRKKASGRLTMTSLSSLLQALLHFAACALPRYFRPRAISAPAPSGSRHDTGIDATQKRPVTRNAGQKSVHTMDA